MFIGVTGLHGAGKSYFTKNVPPQYGFSTYYKNDVIADIYHHVPNWQELYRKAYQTDLYNLVTKILSKLPLDKDIVLDAIHNNEEWNIIKSIVPNANLILITAPKDVREKRRIENPKKDQNRIQYWHSIKKDGSVDCLLTSIDWSFNGNSSLEINKRNFEEFLQYAREKEEKYFEDELKNAIEQEKEVDEKLNSARRLLEIYKNIGEKNLQVQER